MQPQVPQQPAYDQQQPAYFAYPPVNPVYPQPVHPQYLPQLPPVPVAPQPRASRWRALVAVLVLVAMAAMIGWQAVRLRQLGNRLEAMSQLSAVDRGDRDAKAEALTGRVSVLEKDLFHPDKIAATALPSVFRVRAGAFTGTAFAVGKNTATGGTNLFTNYHVVEAVWKRGDRKVAIEHRELRFDATIVKVDKDKDLAQLETTEKVPGLAVSTTELHPGEHIVVVGAPLGLESSVTTGVVSAVRDIAALGGKVVQFDAAINPGNSGGPVINAQLQVVGIASAQLRDTEGIGLAIPIATACERFPICS